MPDQSNVEKTPGFVGKQSQDKGVRDSLVKNTDRSHALSAEEQTIFNDVNNIIFSDISKAVQANRIMALISPERAGSYKSGLRRALKLLDGTGVWDEKTRNELLSLMREIKGNLK